MCTECNRHTGHADGCPNATLYDTYTIECALCGKEVDETEATYGICEDCWSKSHTFDTALEYGKTAQESIKINGLFAKVLSPDQINEALKTAVLDMKKFYYDFTIKSAQSFLGDDDHDFADYLKGEKKCLKAESECQK